MSDHTVTIECEPTGYWPSLRFRCQASTDAPCRMMCNRSECEEGCVDPEHHEREPLGYCNFVEWMDNSDDPAGLIFGGPTEVTVPVEFEWCGTHDGPDWRFAPTPVAHDVPLPIDVAS